MALLPTPAAAVALGLSTRTLLRWRAHGWLVAGAHWHQGPHPNSTLRWDVATIRATQLTPTAGSTQLRRTAPADAY